MNPKKPKETLPEDTRERLLVVAKKLFAEKSFEGTTIRDLADAAQVNLSMVSYHFGGKEGLLAACLNQFGEQSLAIAKRILHPPASAEELRIRLEMYAEEFIVWHFDQKSVATILHRECEMGSNPAVQAITQDLFRNTFVKIFEVLVTFFEGARKNKLLAPALKPSILAGMFFGTMAWTTMKDDMNLKYFGKTLSDAGYRKDFLEHLMNFTTNGCLNHPDRSP